MFCFTYWSRTRMQRILYLNAASCDLCSLSVMYMSSLLLLHRPSDQCFILTLNIDVNVNDFCRNRVPSTLLIVSEFIESASSPQLLIWMGAMYIILVPCLQDNVQRLPRDDSPSRQCAKARTAFKTMCRGHLVTIRLQDKCVGATIAFKTMCRQV